MVAALRERMKSRWITFSQPQPFGFSTDHLRRIGDPEQDIGSRSSWVGRAGLEYFSSIFLQKTIFVAFLSCGRNRAGDSGCRESLNRETFIIFVDQIVVDRFGSIERHGYWINTIESLRDPSFPLIFISLIIRFLGFSILLLPVKFEKAISQELQLLFFRKLSCLKQ